MLKKVQIADLTLSQGKVKIITAEKGEISTEEGSKYMTLTLQNGNYYEEHSKRSMTQNERKRMPASAATFDTYTINIDISSFNDDKDLDNEDITQHHGMLSINQLDSISKVEKSSYDKYLEERSTNFYNIVKADKLYKYPDSIRDTILKPEILDNFSIANKTIILGEALQILKRATDRINNQQDKIKRDRKRLNLYDYEYNYRFSFSLACLVLFFIGAPLGSIIRKGGFGLPMIMAITIFVIYFFISQFGKNLSEESAITTLLGGWISTLILLPFGILLTRRATQGMGIFNIDSVLDSIKKFFNRFTKKSIKQL